MHGKVHSYKFPWQNDDEEKATVKKLAKSLAASAKTWINSDEGGKNQPSKDSKNPRKRKMANVSNVNFGVLSKRLKECTRLLYNDPFDDHCQAIIVAVAIILAIVESTTVRRYYVCNDITM